MLLLIRQGHQLQDSSDRVPHSTERGSHDAGRSTHWASKHFLPLSHLAPRYVFTKVQGRAGSTLHKLRFVMF